MFLGWPFSKIVREILIRQKMWLWWMGATCTIQKSRNSLKTFSWNRWSDFEIISQGCSLGDPFQNSSVKFWSIKKCGPGEWGLLALYRNEGILKKSSSLKPLVRFWNNFTELFLGWPFSKIVREILIGEETWLWWMGATCTIGKWGNS